MIRRIAFAAFLACLSSLAWAQTAAPLPDGPGYADPQCLKPQMTLVRPESGNGAATASYNAKVRTFNGQASAYDLCMHAYIDNANRDVKAIQDKANADLKQITERANASMKAIQDKIRQAVADANAVTAALDQETAKLRKP